MGYTRITITVEDKLLKAYKKFCKDNAIKLSTRIQLLMKKDLNKISKRK